MNIRNLDYRDIPQLTEIHETYYKHEFSLDEFQKFFLDFVVIEDQNVIIAAGGIRPIAESVIMTNKDTSNRLKRAALYQMLSIQSAICKSRGFDQLHAFVQDEVWKQHLINRAGFKPCKGDALFVGVD